MRPHGEFTEERLSAILAQNTVTTVARVRRMQQIADWLAKLGMSEYAERFAENNIDASVLPHLQQRLKGRPWALRWGSPFTSVNRTTGVRSKPAVRCSRDRQMSARKSPSRDLPEPSRHFDFGRTLPDASRT